MRKEHLLHLIDLCMGVNEVVGEQGEAIEALSEQIKHEFKRRLALESLLVNKGFITDEELEYSYTHIANVMEEMSNES